MTTACFFLGPPGVGKTSLVRKLLGVPGFGVRLIEKPKWTVGDEWCAAGHYTGDPYDGGDTVPYNGVRYALDYWRRALSVTTPLTVFDGDRFSHESALDAIELVAESTVAVYLSGTEELLTARRAARGSNQDPAWMKGRATKAQRFSIIMQKRSLKVWMLDADNTTEELARQVRHLLDTKGDT